MKRLALIMAVLFAFMTQVVAQDSGAGDGAMDRSATGGAQTLEDILKRQRGEKVDYDFKRNATGDPNSAAGISSQMGTLGGVSDPELWRALRYGSADITVSSGGKPATVLMQDGGMRWLEWRKGPLATYGGILLLATLAFLGLFYLLRGRIRIDGEKTGQTITRFKAIERFGHWLLGGSFILLGLTGLITLFGRMLIIPLIGHDAFYPIAHLSKWVHNNVSWAFMLGLVMVFVMWVAHNIPNKTDLKWIAVGGGLLKKGVHPPAKKFNFGQKMIFWSVIVFGALISITGLSLLFPFQMPMFAAVSDALNATGLPQLLGFGTLPTELAPHEDMQLAQLWHAILAFILMAIVLAHIYIGSVGMEGAYDAMGTGEVELQWAREHHGLWVKEVEAAEANEKERDAAGAVPAE
ncbi:formate dehydrogenase subunit gamma [Labrenzia sp. PHM005]|uniref:formate dehydrogenase subunit gamma n=1 Tax=Labrenzia sp. PHM005 TaxID=2590016 RepID=UPI00114088BD|nr:formate dehydrogenase subunit gamma [Labrenzia sp. PHM005]QDG75923.1 formate dehydrogenase subunit gamma [Labrenzia sp. PHM005]